MQFKLLEHYQGLEFDGHLLDDNGESALLECRIRAPLIGGDVAAVELRIPNSGDCVGSLSNPCSIKGSAVGGRLEIELGSVYYRTYTMSGTAARKTGSSKIELSHVGVLKILTHSDARQSATTLDNNVQKILFHLNRNEYFHLPSWLDVVAQLPFKENESFCKVTVPKLGVVSITREWVFTQLPDQSNGAAKWGLCAEVDVLAAAGSSDVETYVAQFGDLLFVLSFFTRQRLVTLAREVTYRDRVEQTWKDPLDPLSTENVSRSREKFLADGSVFEDAVNTATETFLTLSPEIKELCRELSIGLIPFVTMAPAQRFLSMFQALESCRKFALLGLAEDDLDKTELVRILAQAKEGTSESISKRIDGFIRLVEGTTPSLKVQLQAVLAQWAVQTDDLWPLSGSQRLPGLIQIRDKIVHSGPLSLRFQALADATKHLSVLIERVVLRLLQIPLQQTNVHPDVLDRDHWYYHEHVLEQRKMAFEPDSSS